MRFLPGPRSPHWVFVESGVAAILSLLSMLAIGRVIGPHEAGIGAIAIAAFLLLDVLGSVLFTDALIQRPDLTPRHARSALTFAALVGGAAALAMLAAAPVLEWAVNSPGLGLLLLALALPLPLSAFSGAAAGLVSRDHRFGLMALRVLLCQPLALAAGLAAALGGLGAWAMVLSQAVATTGVFLLFLAVGRLPLRPLLDRAALADLWPIALPQIGAYVLILGRYRLFLVALGLVVAEAVLALAHFAFRMVDAVLSMVYHAVNRIAMPRLCALQADRAALTRCYGGIVQLQALVGLPVSLGIALVAHDLVAALLGPAWEGTAEAARIAGFAAAVTYLHGSHVALFVAVGRARRNLAVAAAEMAVPLAALAILHPQTPAGIALAWASTCLVVTPVVAWLVLREIGRSPLWLLRHAMPGLAGAAAMVPTVLAVQEAAAGLPPLARLVLAATLGAATYLAVAWMALGARSPAALDSWRRPRAPARGISPASGAPSGAAGGAD